MSNSTNKMMTVIPSADGLTYYDIDATSMSDDDLVATAGSSKFIITKGGLVFVNTTNNRAFIFDLDNVYDDEKSARYAMEGINESEALALYDSMIDKYFVGAAEDGSKTVVQLTTDVRSAAILTNANIASLAYNILNGVIGNYSYVLGAQVAGMASKVAGVVYKFDMGTAYDTREAAEATITNG